MIFLIVIIAAGVLCVGGLGIGYVLYNRVSQPDRSTPTVAVHNYLDATFVMQDTDRAKLVTCGDPGKITEIQQLVTDIKRREKQFTTTITVMWESLTDDTSGSSATVNGVLRLSVTVNGFPQEEIQHWRFSVEDRSGWRVCDAHRVD